MLIYFQVKQKCTEKISAAKGVLITTDTNILERKIHSEKKNDGSNRYDCDPACVITYVYGRRMHPSSPSFEPASHLSAYRHSSAKT
jgi:hypothetical protein